MDHNIAAKKETLIRAKIRFLYSYIKQALIKTFQNLNDTFIHNVITICRHPAFQCDATGGPGQTYTWSPMTSVFSNNERQKTDGQCSRA